MNDMEKVELRKLIQEELALTNGRLEAITDYIMGKETPKTGQAMLDEKRLNWQSAQGPKGPYEMVDTQADPALFEKIQKHGGFLAIEGKRYWISQRGDRIMRR